jgi:tetratricopeptide (TPR) repeat protein
VAFLRARTGRDDPAGDELAAVLGDLPLALEQAAAYLEQTRTSLREYLELFQERAGELLGLGEPADYPHTVATTWTLSLWRLRAEAPAAEDLLAVCGFLAPDDIPRSLLVEHATVLPERLQQAVTDRLAYGRMLGALGRYGLVTVTKDSLAVHRLVQAVIREGVNQQAKRQWARAAVRLVLAAFPDDSHDVRGWPRCARLLPHALIATDHARTLAADPAATAGLLNEAGRYLWSRTELRQARQLLETALTMREDRYGPDHPDVAQSLNNLGNVLRELGELSAARTYLERALAIFEARLGPDSPRVGNSLSNLGFVLHDLGDLAAARDAHQRALAIRTTQLGSDHRDTAYSHNNLGAVLRDQGELSAARSHLERALTIFEARLGPDHPDVAMSLDNLGLVLAELGELPAARDAFARALASREARLGSDHPDTVNSMTNLTEVRRKL